MFSRDRLSPQDQRPRKSARERPLPALLQPSELHRSAGDGRRAALALFPQNVCGWNERYFWQRFHAATGSVDSGRSARSGRESGPRDACRSLWPQPRTHSDSLSRRRTHQRRQPDNLPQRRGDLVDPHAVRRSSRSRSKASTKRGRATRSIQGSPIFKLGLASRSSHHPSAKQVRRPMKS